MDQAILSKLAVPISTMADLMEQHPATPSAWKHNIRPFLRNQASIVTSKKAWEWVIKVWKSGRYDITAPFAFTRSILADPWFKFPDVKAAWSTLTEKVTDYGRQRRRKSKGLQEKGKSDNQLQNLSSSNSDSDSPSSPLPSEQVHESTGHPLDCGCLSCHLWDVQLGGFDCQVGKNCKPCGSGVKIPVPS